MTHELERLRGAWLAPFPLLGIGSGWWEPALAAAAALTAAQVVAYLRSGAAQDPVQVQVRMICVLLLVLGTVPPFGVLHLLVSAMAAGQLVFGRCVLTRALRAAPWNRPLPPIGAPAALGCR
jgi:hypothetical protein